MLETQMKIINLLMIFLSILHIVLSSSNYVNCRIACKKCQDAEEELELLEVYCSMCKECRDSRRQRTKMSSTDAVDIKHIFVPVRQNTPKVQDNEVTTVVTEKKRTVTETTTAAVTATPSIAEAWPEGCPTPPVCDDETTHDLEPLTKPHTTKTTTTPTTTTTEAITCPPISTCKPKTTAACCFPMCAVPCGGQLPNKIDIDIHFVTDDGLQSLRHSQAAPAENTHGDKHSIDLNIPVNFDGQFNLHGEGTLAQNGQSIRNGLPNNRNENSNHWNTMNHKSGDDYYYVYLGVPKNAIGAK